MGLRIGVDVGGTNTDAVAMDGRTVLASYKAPTSENVSDGIVQAIQSVLNDSSSSPADVSTVMIGTTHFTNAFVERKHLLEVAVVRVALPASRGIPPLIDWPDDIASAIGSHVYLIRGGYQYDGRMNAPLDETALLEAARGIRQKGLRSVAISGLFSPVQDAMERRAHEILANELPDAVFTLSSQIGRIGLLERENAAVMNASLADLATSVIEAFRHSLGQLDIKAPFFVSQNDGTLMSAEHVEKYPVLTFASGPTNSMRGAAYLSGQDNAIVVDIGGTTTDIGMLTNGFPRESSVTVDIGGVRTNFRMPDIVALGLGGGGRVVLGEDIRVGPDSVGFELTKRGLCFGGDTLTASDVAVAAGYAEMGDQSLVSHLKKQEVDRAVDRMHEIVGLGVDRIKTSAHALPVILVGGGAVLINRDLPGTKRTLVPEHAGVANAIGASIAQISGEVDRVCSYESIGRDAALASAKADAIAAAVSAGADESSVVVTDIEEVPLQYVPGGTVRLRVKAAGDLALSGV